MDSKYLSWLIRKDVLEMTHSSRGSHIGSALSIVDILAVLYSDIMKYDPKNPNDVNRDRFVLSKGHAGVAIYSVLSRCGFFSPDKLYSYYENGSNLSGHVSHINVPGVEISTGSLGHGISVSAGMALAAKKDGKRHRVFTIIGDGECNEGSVWETALFANHFRLNNFIVIIDHNKIQSLDFCENTIELLSLSEKFISFGWNVKTVNGHDHNEILDSLSVMHDTKPTCIIANTIKGKGFSFMENTVLWHYRDPQGEFYEIAKKELEEQKP